MLKKQTAKFTQIITVLTQTAFQQCK